MTDTDKKIKELLDKHSAIKKLEAEMFMKKGEFDDEIKALMKEMGFQEEQQFNVVELLAKAKGIT